MAISIVHPTFVTCIFPSSDTIFSTLYLAWWCTSTVPIYSPNTNKICLSRSSLSRYFARVDLSLDRRERSECKLFDDQKTAQ